MPAWSYLVASTGCGQQNRTVGRLGFYLQRGELFYRRSKTRASEDGIVTTVSVANPRIIITFSAAGSRTKATMKKSTPFAESLSAIVRSPFIGGLSSGSLGSSGLFAPL